MRRPGACLRRCPSRAWFSWLRFGRVTWSSMSAVLRVTRRQFWLVLPSRLSVLKWDEGLAEQASQTLMELEVDNAAVVTGPLAEGYPSEGPFDVILMNGCVPSVPQALLDQLKDQGRLVTILAEHDFGRAYLYGKERRPGEPSPGLRCRRSAASRIFERKRICFLSICHNHKGIRPRIAGKLSQTPKGCCSNPTHPNSPVQA